MITDNRKHAVPLVTSFLRYNLSAFTATTVDFLTLTFFKEVFGVYYVLATFLGGMAGGSVAFFLGRNWTFLNKHGGISIQGAKFIGVVVGSILLNTFGVYFYKDILQIDHYMVARVITAITIGITYNFPMQRYFVFR